MICTEQETDYLTVEEVARKCRVTVQCVYNWIGRGKLVGGVAVYLQADRYGGVWRIGKEALREFSRRSDRRTWQDVAQRQDVERRQAKRDQSRSREGK